MGLHSVSSQTDLNFENVIDKLASNEAEINHLKIAFNQHQFSANNVKIHTNMKCLTGFSMEQFFVIFNFLALEQELGHSNDNVLIVIDQFFFYF